MPTLSSSAQPLAMTNVLPVPMDLTILSISCKWNQAICVTFVVQFLLLA